MAAHVTRSVPGRFIEADFSRQAAYVNHASNRCSGRHEDARSATPRPTRWRWFPDTHRQLDEDKDGHDWGRGIVRLALYAWTNALNAPKDWLTWRRAKRGAQLRGDSRGSTSLFVLHRWWNGNREADASSAASSWGSGDALQTPSGVSQAHFESEIAEITIKKNLSPNLMWTHAMPLKTRLPLPLGITTAAATRSVRWCDG